MCDYCLKSHVLWVTISILDCHHWADLNGPVGELEWDRNWACWGWDLLYVPIQQVERDKEWQSCSMVEWVQIRSHCRQSVTLPFPLGLWSMSEYNFTLVSAPPGGPVGVSEGLTELDRTLWNWRQIVKSLVSPLGFTCNAICLVIPLQPIQVDCLSLLLAVHFTCPSVSCRYLGLLLLARDCVL